MRLTPPSGLLDVTGDEEEGEVVSLSVATSTGVLGLSGLDEDAVAAGGANTKS